MSLLEGKTILATGSTTGIGEAVARRCIAEGARVMIHGRSETRAAALVEELGERAAYITADLVQPGAPAYLIEQTGKRFGGLDGLVNNAALVDRANLAGATEEFFDRMFAANLRAPLFLIQSAIPYFRRAGGGSVVNIGSVNAYCGEPNLLVYSMTKGGLMTMTRNVADALAGTGIRINQLNVGWTLTENERKLKRAEGLPEGWEFQVPRAYAPSGRILDPAEVASQVAFWLSDESAPVSGAVYEVEQYPVIGRNPHKEG